MKINDFSLKSKRNFLVVLLMVTAVIGAGALKYMSPYQLQPLSSSANEEHPHWRHGTIPFTINVLNHASANWPKPLLITTDAWSESGLVKYNIVPAERSNLCEIYPESINFCSWNEADGWLSQFMYMQGPNDPHIIAGVFTVNDYYLQNNKSEYATDAWRNNTLCQALGFIMGMSVGLDGVEGFRPVESCMNNYKSFGAIETMQKPDRDDYREFAGLYNHIDENPSDAHSYKVANANSFWINKDFGTLASRTTNGVETYEKDLGNGYKMITVKQPILDSGQNTKPATKSKGLR